MHYDVLDLTLSMRDGLRKASPSCFKNMYLRINPNELYNSVFNIAYTREIYIYDLWYARIDLII